MSDPATSEPPWDHLRAEARRMSAAAYAPYSGVHVGAAALVDDGRIVTGANVENASYGLTLCAECSVASALISSGGGCRLQQYVWSPEKLSAPDRRRGTGISTTSITPLRPI